MRIRQMIKKLIFLSISFDQQISLMNQIQEWHMLHYRDAPDEIQDGMFLPLMKKALIGIDHQRPK